MTKINLINQQTEWQSAMLDRIIFLQPSAESINPLKNLTQDEVTSVKADVSNAFSAEVNAITNGQCGTCKYFEPCEYDDSLGFQRFGGICLLSRDGDLKENKFMQARDEIQEYRPYLEVSDKFGCNQFVLNK